jgi:hypothetical protein
MSKVIITIEDKPDGSCETLINFSRPITEPETPAELIGAKIGFMIRNIADPDRGYTEEWYDENGQKVKT